MTDETISRTIYQAFSEILAYPHASLPATARTCEDLVRRINPAAAFLLGQFCASIEGVTLAQLEELYTAAFDLDASCHPYVGYHLFGESYKRSLFLLGLKERFTTCGLVVERELPDHLAVLLRYLAVNDDPAQAGELIDVALLPALEKMVVASEETPDQAERHDGHRVYQPVLQALRLELQERSEALKALTGAETALVL